MEDFFKQFRDNLERRPPPVFTQKDWENMEKRLDQGRGKRPAALAWQWLAWPLLLLSLGANAVLFHAWKMPLQQFAAPVIQRDTIYQTRWVFRTDTFIRTLVAPAIISESDPARAFASPAITGMTDSRDALCPPIASTERPDSAISRSVENPPTESIAALPPFQPSTLHSVPATPFLPEIPTEPVNRKQRKTLSYHLDVMRPKGFRMGIAGGWTYPFDDRLEHQGGYSAGLEANLEFSPNLRLWLGATFFNMRFITDKMDAALGIPDIAPPTPDFTFVEAEVPQPSLEYAAGMQYFFSTRHKLKPFLGLGYGALATRPYEIVYEFENQSLGVEWSFDHYVNKSEFLANLLLLQTGIECEIFKKWHWQLRATYRTDLKKAGAPPSDQFGIQTVLMRRF